MRGRGGYVRTMYWQQEDRKYFYIYLKNELMYDASLCYDRRVKVMPQAIWEFYLLDILHIYISG